MPTWFDVSGLGFDSVEDEEGMLRSAYAINEMITAEVASGIPAERIVLGGFSQGGAMALLTGLTTEHKLAGLIVLSTRVPMKDKLPSMMSDHAKSLPIFWGTGAIDPIVRLEYAQTSVDFLESTMGIPKTDKEESIFGPIRGLNFNVYYSMTHTVGDEEHDDLNVWLRRIIPDGE